MNIRIEDLAKTDFTDVVEPGGARRRARVQLAEQGRAIAREITPRVIDC